MDPKSLQAEYEAFMLGGKNETTSTPTSTSTKQQQNRQKKKSHQPGTPNSNDNYDRDIRSIFKSYQGRLKEWLENDELVLEILGSISHLRERFRWESKEIMSSSGEKVQTNNDGGVDGCEDYDVCNVSTERGWKNYGFRSSMATTTGTNRRNDPTKSPNKTSVLLRQDVELALDHNVLQHEIMMRGLRSVLRLTGQNIDAIGRRLDEWMMAIYHEEQQHHGYSSQRLMKWKHQLESAQALFVSLSKDLFWKQKALEQILSSYHDGLLVLPSDSTVSLKESPSNRSYNQNGMLLSLSQRQRRNSRVKGGNCSIQSSIEEVLDL
mmetsp:Transcript_57901/g.141471  ORF Transcript_57901/g.141471 Transcript_57901/m.141471 type:complete len:322 (+) Transcript_57901:96-1061(+)